LRGVGDCLHYWLNQAFGQGVEMEGILFTNAMVFDGVDAELREQNVLVEGTRIAEISDAAIRAEGARVIDVHGRTLMPGLIDAHVHAYIPDVNPLTSERLPMTFTAHRARRMFEASLRRGFTSVRDTGGGDYGLHMAIERGLLDGPRLFYSGKAISQTGGHGDMRHPHEEELCTCPGGYVRKLTWVVDGVDAVRHAIREELHRGAHFIKIMGSGGVASMGDRLDSAQFSDDEIRAAVDETSRQGTYVTAHIHPDGALRRCIELGVPCIEHGTLITDETAKLAAERGTSIVPTMAVVKGLSMHGERLGFSKPSMAKLREVEPAALGSLERMKRAGVRMGFGTDLIGELERFQATEFTIRREVLPAIDILRSATSVNAQIIRQEESIGKVAVGMLADLIVVNGNPLDDIGLFDEEGNHVPVVMKDGRIFKDES
jgi:imidazolonepropionase-like amidohydrolase